MAKALMTNASAAASIPDRSTSSPAVLFIRDYLAICEKHGYVIRKTPLDFYEACDDVDDERAVALCALAESGESLIGLEHVCATLLANRAYLPSHTLAAIMRLFGETKCRELVSLEDFDWFFAHIAQDRPTVS